MFVRAASVLGMKRKHKHIDPATFTLHRTGLTEEQFDQRQRDVEWLFTQLAKEDFEAEQRYFERLEAIEQADAQAREADPYSYYGVSRSDFM